MNEPNPNTDHFDVFLCHNSEDKPEIRRIAEQLSSRGLKPWLDEKEIRPGKLWQEILEEQIGTIKAAAVFVGKNGIGPWQKMEMRAFINEFVERDCPVIVVLLPSVTETPKLPILLKNLHRVDFRDSKLAPLEQLIFGITGEKSADTVATKTLLESPSGQVDKMDQAFKEGRRLYPPLVTPPDQEQLAQLRILLNHVQNHWVDGVLKETLHDEGSIALDKKVKEKAVEPPWRYAAPLPDALREMILRDRNITTLFDATGLLLILGEPGSGKTTTLLELAKGLVTRAKNEPNERVPIVLNLSSWEQTQTLEDWIATELSSKYGVPKSIASAWVTRDYLVPLLDGLDELPMTVQSTCVAAINAFIENRRPPGLVVCSRLAEYEWLPQRLTLNGAVCIEPLSSEDVNQFLEARGTKLAGLQQAMSNDSTLRELSQTPLMLDIMSIACAGVSKEALITNEADSFKTRQQHIFHLYVEQMFERKESTSSPFEKHKITNWLSWLARKMKEQSQSIFMMEEVQPSWLSSKGQRLAYQTVIALGVTLLVWLVGLLPNPSSGEQIDTLFTGLLRALSFGVIVVLGCRSTSLVRNSAMCALLGTLLTGGISGIFYNGFSSTGDATVVLLLSLLCGMVYAIFGGLGIGSVNEICLVETIRWQWWQFVKRTMLGTMVGYMLVAPLLLFIVVVIGTLSSLISVMAASVWPKGDVPWELLAVLFLVLLFVGPLFGLIFGLNTASINAMGFHRLTPNQGIWLSLRNGLVALLLFSTAWMACWFLPFSLLSAYGSLGEPIGQHGTPSTFLGIFEFGFAIGLVVFLNLGGSAVLKHYALRMILWRTGSMPLQFIPVLDHCAKLILLKKVGGGYIFIHRTLLEYFAELPSEASKSS